MRLLARAGNRDNSQRTKGQVMTHQEIIDLIQAHGEGKTLQLLGLDRKYEDFKSLSLDVLIYRLSQGSIIRVKPEPRTVWVNFNSNGTVCHSVHNSNLMIKGPTYFKFIEDIE